jgi:DNA-binding transcriptional regulator YhcF (GntR family)
MEEQKNTEKRSYEDLEKENIILSKRLNDAYLRLNSIDMAATRLDFLFRVVDKYAVFDPDFVGMCTSEIQKILFGKEEDTSKTDKK